MTDTLLIIAEEDLPVRELRRPLQNAGWQVELAASVGDARRLLLQEGLQPAAVLAELALQDGNALELLESLHDDEATFGEFLLLTSDIASDASRAEAAGAYAVLEKPYDATQLELLLRRAAESARARRRLADHVRAQRRRYAPSSFAGASAAAREARQWLESTAQSDADAVMLRGDPGTGKRLAARILHYSSARAAGPLLEICCAGVPDEQLRAVLFGSDAGAPAERRGLVEQAEGGSLIVDEIGDLSPPLQTGLLKALAEHRVRRGANGREFGVDFRLIALTSRDLEQQMTAGRFHPELYRRLAMAQLQLAPLVERQEDIEPLVWSFIERDNRRHGKNIRQVNDGVWQILREHPWVGNVRELRNVIERAILLTEGEVLEPQWLSLTAGTASPTGNALCFALDGRIGLDEIERRLIEEGLMRRNGNVTQAAKLLGISRQTLRYRIEKHRLTPSRPSTTGLDD